MCEWLSHARVARARWFSIKIGRRAECYQRTIDPNKMLPASQNRLCAQQLHFTPHNSIVLFSLRIKFVVPIKYIEFACHSHPRRIEWVDAVTMKLIQKSIYDKMTNGTLLHTADHRNAWRSISATFILLPCQAHFIQRP